MASNLKKTTIAPFNFNGTVSPQRLQNVLTVQPHRITKPVAKPGISPQTQAAGGGIPSTGGFAASSKVQGTNMLPVSYNGNQRSYPVEVPINSAAVQYAFPDVQTLLGKRIIGIESFSANEVSYGPLSGIANIPQAAQKAMSLQLNDATNTALMDHHALVDFDPQLNNGLIRYIDFTNIVWTNCKLFLPNNALPTIAAPPYVAYFMIWYLNEG